MKAYQPACSLLICILQITVKSTYNYILHGPYIRLIQQNQANGRRIEAFYLLYDAGTSDRTKLEIKADHSFTLYDQWAHFVSYYYFKEISQACTGA